MIQCQFINYLLSTRNVNAFTSNNLTEDFFSNYKNEFNFIKTHVELYNEIPDVYTFASAFPDFDLLDDMENVSLKYLLDALYEERRGQLGVNAATAVLSAAKARDVDKIQSIAQELNEQLAMNNHIGCVDIIRDWQHRYQSFLDKNQDYTKFYVKTGFDELDAVFGGWDRKEELATIVARPGIGKSWVLLKTALSAAEQGLRVGFYSGEMSEDVVGARLDTLAGHLSNYAITRGEDKVLVSYQKFLEDLPNKVKGSIKVLTPNSVGGPVGVTALRAFIERENLDMLCIDQHSLLEDDRKGRTPTEKAANISKDLKILQVLKKIPIIAVSQQNRSSTEEKGVGTEHVAQSDRISQDSTIVIFLDQPNRRKRKDEDEDDVTEDTNIMEFEIVKSRNTAAGGHLSYSIDLNYGYFEYTGDKEDALKGQKVAANKSEFDGAPAPERTDVETPF